MTAAPEAVDKLIEMVAREPALLVTVDLAAMQVTAGIPRFAISMPAAARDGFLDGSWDATGLLLERYEEVEAVEARLPYAGSCAWRSASLSLNRNRCRAHDLEEGVGGVR